MSKLLIIDDDDRMTELLTSYLGGHGFEVQVARDGLEGVARVERESFDIVVLDVMLPGIDGIECLRRIRRVSEVPLLMLTARGDETDRIVGLEMGADDYLPKPFNPRELVARIKGILRRSTRPLPGPGEKGLIRFPTFLLDTHRRALQVDGEDVTLTSVEFDLLHCLIRHAGQVMSRDQLMDEVRGQDYAALDRTIDVHISRLRQKIEPDVRNPRYIKTIWGAGYLLVKEP